MLYPHMTDKKNYPEFKDSMKVKKPLSTSEKDRIKKKAEKIKQAANRKRVSN